MRARKPSWIPTTVLALAAVAAAPTPAEPWGYTAHRLVNRKAVALLPPPLGALFAGNADYLAEHSVDPDLWRGAGAENEGPQHFLDLDAFGRPPFAEVPLGEADHLARHGAEAAGKGRLPWRVQEGYRDLVAALRAGEGQRTLERAAVLGHYVADAHVPLHAVLNYDGQLTGQTGLHSRWESELVDRFERQIEHAVRPGPARHVGNPVAFTLGVLRESFAGAEGVLAADRASAGAKDLADTPFDDRYDHGYYSRLYERESPRVIARLSAASRALASLWLQAWQEAGRPALDPAYRVPYVRGRSRGLLVSLDGAGAAVVDDAVARGLMPRLARLRAAGATARGSLTTQPPKTAPGHAALYTGAWSDRNGISGNDAVKPGGSVLARESGYASTLLRAEPLWVTAARQGLEVSVASATQVYPFAPYLEERRFGGNFGRNLTLFDGYQDESEGRVWTAGQLAPRDAGEWQGPLPSHEGALREVELTVAGTPVNGLLYDDPGDPVHGLDTLYLALDRDTRRGITLKAPPAQGPRAEAFAGLTVRVAGGEAAVFFRLFELSPEASEIRLYQTAPKVLRSSRSRLVAPALAATGGFVGNGAAWSYERGELGPTLWQGGDGTAERRYLESVALVVRQMTRLSDFVHDRTDWTLLLTYLPYPDEALHVWLGRLDPTLPGHDPALAARLRPFLDEVLRLTDGFVGHLADRAGPEVVLAVAADHGLAGAARLVRPNVALAKAGLLALDPQGRVDLARTQAVYFPGNSGFVVLNRASRPGGVVGPEAEEALGRAVQAALLGLVDPATGQKPVPQLRAPGAASGEPGIGGPTGGDFYLELAPGYDLSAELQGDAVAPLAPRGMHSGNPERPELRASFTVSGPGVAAGVDLGPIRQIDVSPTLCALLGLDPPAQATGQVLTAALARR